MKNQEIENGRDDMIIDGGNAVPEGLNLNYFKVYYGKRFGLSTSGSSASYDCVIMC